MSTISPNTSPPFDVAREVAAAPAPLNWRMIGDSPDPVVFEIPAAAATWRAFSCCWGLGWSGWVPSERVWVAVSHVRMGEDVSGDVAGISAAGSDSCGTSGTSAAGSDSSGTSGVSDISSIATSPKLPKILFPSGEAKYESKLFFSGPRKAAAATSFMTIAGVMGAGAEGSECRCVVVGMEECGGSDNKQEWRRRCCCCQIKGLFLSDKDNSSSCTCAGGERNSSSSGVVEKNMTVCPATTHI